MQKCLLKIFLSMIFACIALLFWYNEWRYTLATPIPAGYYVVNAGAKINIPATIRSVEGKPVFLHFFNPNCPCSKFNIPHFKSLVAKYTDKIEFAVVVMTKDRSYNQENIREKFGIDVPVLFDASLATACGVYSTPQAVLLDSSGSLYYRGNYNRSRYCTDKNSSYAQTAIESLLADHRQPVFDHFALTAYGCSLPGCTK